MPILRRLINPTRLLQAVILFSIVANGMKPQEYFELVRTNSGSEASDEDHWSLSEILFLNGNLKLGFDRVYL